MSILQGQLRLLDKGDVGALREQVNMLMDGELLTTCMLLKEEPGPRRKGEILPTADGSDPANGQDPGPVRFYPAVASACNV